MGYKMKGSPAKLGTIKGTSGHKSALKTAIDDAMFKAKAQMNPSPAKDWKDFGKESLSKVKSSKKVMTDLASDKDKTTIKAEELKGLSKETKAQIQKDKKSIKKQASKVGKKTTDKAARRQELKKARKEGRAARKEERYQKKLARAGETQEERLTRRRARNEKISHTLDLIFNPEQAAKTESEQRRLQNAKDIAQIRAASRSPESKDAIEFEQNPDRVEETEKIYTADDPTGEGKKVDKKTTDKKE